MWDDTYARCSPFPLPTDPQQTQDALQNAPQVVRVMSPPAPPPQTMVQVSSAKAKLSSKEAKGYNCTGSSKSRDHPRQTQTSKDSGSQFQPFRGREELPRRMIHLSRNLVTWKVLLERTVEHSEGLQFGWLLGWEWAWPQENWVTSIIWCGLHWPWDSSPSTLLTSRISLSGSINLSVTGGHIRSRSPEEHIRMGVSVRSLHTIQAQLYPSASVESASTHQFIQLFWLRMVTVAQVCLEVCSHLWFVMLNLAKVCLHIPTDSG